MKIHNSRSIANRMRRQGESWALVNVTILARKYHLQHFLMNTTLLGVVYRSMTKLSDPIKHFSVPSGLQSICTQDRSFYVNL
jgi:hypothetical protein